MDGPAGDRDASGAPRRVHAARAAAWTARLRGRPRHRRCRCHEVSVPSAVPGSTLKDVGESGQ